MAVRYAARMPDASRPVGDLTNDQIRKRLRVPVQEAARLLGISPEAVRSRLYRGTLDKETGTDGSVYVRLHADQVRHNDDQADDQAQPGDALVEEMRARIEDLKDQLDTANERLDREQEARTEERRRHDTLIAQLTQANAALSARIPELPAAETSEAREPPESSGPTRTPDTAGGPETGAEQPQRSWWRRVLGG